MDCVLGDRRRGVLVVVEALLVVVVRIARERGRHGPVREIFFLDRERDRASDDRLDAIFDDDAERHVDRVVVVVDGLNHAVDVDVKGVAYDVDIGIGREREGNRAVFLQRDREDERAAVALGCRDRVVAARDDVHRVEEIDAAGLEIEILELGRIGLEAEGDVFIRTGIDEERELARIRRTAAATTTAAAERGDQG